MPLVIRELAPDDAELVRAFNARLAKAGVTFSFPMRRDELLPRDPGSDAPFQDAYVLTDGAAVRGGYILKEERLCATGTLFAAGNYQLPLSEGIVDRRYALAGLQLIRDALARQPRLYCLGMGSTERPLPQLLTRLGWTVSKVPFLFRVERAGRFARELRWVRQRRAWRRILDLARYSGALALYVGLSRLRRRVFSARPPRDLTLHPTASFPADVDELFLRVRESYGLLCDRRAAAMNRKLPPADPKLFRLLAYRSGRLVGWVSYSRSQLNEHAQFGDMALGCIVDGLAEPEVIDALVSSACARLAGCDLLVSNQSHPAWIAALRRQGFSLGPSNFVLALSPALAAAADRGRPMHFTRADGDGPINL